MRRQGSLWRSRRGASLTAKVIVVSLAFGACAPRNPQVTSTTTPRLGADREEPKWRTPEGRQAVWRDMAWWYVDNGMAKDAMEMVDRLRADGVEAPYLDVIQARALAVDGLPAEAERMLRDVVAAHPKEASAWRALGVVYVDLARTDQALSAFQQAVELEPDDAKTLNNFGFVLLSAGRCEEAQGTLEQAVEQDGKSARYRTNLAFALVCTGEARRALDLLRSVLPEADARYNLGIAYENLDKAPAAVLQYEQALDVDPDHELAAEALERLAARIIPSDPQPGALP